jgi:hypothetical protein
MINSDIRIKLPSKAHEEKLTFEPQLNEDGEEVFRAGQFAPAGTYLDTDNGRQVTLEINGPLPASLDGRRAYYRRYERAWGTPKFQERQLEHS